MISDPRFITALYFLVSVAGFWCLRSVSRRISGDNFTDGKFWVFFALFLFWGGNQMSVARFGQLMSFMPAVEAFEGDYIIRWIAFITAIAQAFFFPSEKEPKRWFSRK